MIVAFGEHFGRYFYLFQGIAAYLLCAIGGAAFGNYLIAVALLPYVACHFLVWDKMVTIGHGKELNKVLGKTSANILLFGLLLSAGLIFG